VRDLTPVDSLQKQEIGDQRPHESVGDGRCWLYRLGGLPVFCLEEEIEVHRANALICDINGGEVETCSCDPTLPA